MMEGYGYSLVKGKWVKAARRDDIRAVPVGFYVEDDGGRAKAGYLGKAGDCVTRAFAIAQFGPGPSGEQYKSVYAELGLAIHEWAWEGRSNKYKRPYRDGKRAFSPRDGVPREVIGRYAKAIGFSWVATKFIGQTETVHVRPDELPSGRLVLNLSKHLAAMIDGKLYDNHDSSVSRHVEASAGPGSGRGWRMVYGYWVR